MDSRWRVAATACLTASSLFASGAGGAIAVAEPPTGEGDAADRHTNQSLGGSRGGADREHAEQDSADNDAGRRSPDVKAPNEKGPDRKPREEKPPGERGGTGEDPKDPDGEDHEEEEEKPGWHWWPFPCPDPGEPPSSGGGGGGSGGGDELPSGRPDPPPDMQIPPPRDVPSGEAPVEPAVISAVPGAVAAISLAPITVPVIVVPTAGLGAAGAAPPAAPAPRVPAAPRPTIAEPPAGRAPLPANAGGDVAVPAAPLRAGYGEYLRTAGMSQLVAVAVPGLAGLLILTGAGGLLGYRQANAGLAVRTGGAGRFLN